jgi:hypothetical protein
MPESLTSQELIQLVRRVFLPGPQDRALAIMVDVPDAAHPDHPAWRQRRRMARAWSDMLSAQRQSLGLQEVSLAWYRNSGANNADLPPVFIPAAAAEVPNLWRDIADRDRCPFLRLFQTHSLILAPTEFSATAPLKVAARSHPFRAATMPGFLPSMIPALRIDYGEVNRRVNLLKSLCDAADEALIITRAGGRRHHLKLDLRHRLAHASGGLFPQNGVAGNLPSGEAYIVPYEGEKAGQASQSAGELPVQLGNEVVLYRIANNRAIEVLSHGPESERERQKITAEPAYANIAELGLGVLGDFGLDPVGSILLDEKLGLHIAFGRSDHFGGRVGPADFSRPENVVHLDRVYIPQTQPLVQVEALQLQGPSGELMIIKEGHYHGLFGSAS